MLITNQKLGQINVEDIIEKSIDDIPKDKMIMFAYGTLKRGFYNHSMMGDNKYFGQAELKGYRMFTNGIYPAIVKSDIQEDVIHGELYEVDVETFDGIMTMELNSGYHIDEVEVESYGKMIKVPVFAMNKSITLLSLMWKHVKDGIFK